MPSASPAWRLLALINSGMSAADAPVARGLTLATAPRSRQETYDISLMIMVLAAAEGRTDDARVTRLVRTIGTGAIRSRSAGEAAGHYGQALLQGLPDNSNSQFAVLGLRDAQYAGAPVSRHVWELARDYWTKRQNPDGGWSYQARGPASTNSMTVAGVSTLALTEAMLRAGKDEDADGNPVCCGNEADDDTLERGIAWLGREEHYELARESRKSRPWAFYALYGLERAGRLSGRQYFGRHDWYREGAEILLKKQDQNRGSWESSHERNVVGTSMDLLFLSKGLAPVLINKLKYGAHPGLADDKTKGKRTRVPTRVPPERRRVRREREQWNLHPHDTRNLTEVITRLPNWPKLLVTQEVDIENALARGGVQELLQAPLLFINGANDPGFGPPEIELLKEYIRAKRFHFC